MPHLLAAHEQLLRLSAMLEQNGETLLVAYLAPALDNLETRLEERPTTLETTS